MRIGDAALPGVASSPRGLTMARFETGERILEFWFNGWPEGFYHDESNVEIEDVDGNIVLDNDAEYDLYDLGLVVSLDDDSITFEFCDVFNEWLSKQCELMCPECKEILGFVQDDKLVSGKFLVVSGVVECRNCGWKGALNA